MATSKWRFGKNGNWAQASNWSLGAPGAADDAQLLASSPYTVTLSDARSVANLYLKGAGTTLVETGTGSLTIAAGGVIDVRAGASLVLKAANTGLAAAITINGASVTVGANGALGSGAITLQNAALFATTDVTIGNDLSASNGTVRLGATTGATMTFTGTAANSAGYRFGDATHGGTVVFRASAGSLGSADVDGGKLVLGSAIDGGATIATGATLDMNGYGIGTTRATLDGGGRLTNSGALATVRITNTTFEGSVDGAIVIRSPEPNGGFRGLRTVIQGPVTLTDGGGVIFTNSANQFNAGLKIAAGGGLTLAYDETNPNVLTSLSISGGPVGIAGTITVENASTLALQSSGTISGAIINGENQMRGAGRIAITDDASVRITGQIGGVGLSMTSTGTLTLTQANTLASFSQSAGTTTIANVAALGAGSVSLANGAVVSAVTGTIANALFLGDGGTLAAVSGKTVTFSGDLPSSGTVIIGTAAAKGVVILNGAISGDTLSVAAGTLRAGSSAQAQGGLAQFENVSIATGAKIDLAGQSITLNGLAGAGSIASASSAALTLAGATYGGVISGKVAVTIADDPTGNRAPGSTFTTTQTYTGGTTIAAGAALSLGNGGTGGAIAGAIVNNGALLIDHSDATTLSNAISGTGTVEQAGTGVARITGVNSYSGGTIVSGGVLNVADGRSLGSGDVSIGQGAVLETRSSMLLGSGVVHITGGQLLVSTGRTLGGTLDLSQAGTVAVAVGATLDLTANVHVAAGDGAYLVLGNGGNNGTILLHTTDAQIDGAFGLFLDIGTIKLASAAAAELTGGALGVRIPNAGTVFDLNGYSVEMGYLNQGGGTITNTGAAARMTIGGGESNGAISGAITLVAQTDIALRGEGSFARLVVDGAHTVTIGAKASETIELDGTGATLALASGAALTGHIAEFGEGDRIDFDGLSFDSAARFSFSASTGVLRVGDANRVVSVTLDGAYAKSDLQLSNDGDGHIRISYVGAPETSSIAPHAFTRMSPSAFGSSDIDASHLFVEHIAAVLMPDMMLV